MAKYRVKLTTVDAEQFFHDQQPWPPGVYEVDGEYRVDTLEGEAIVVQSGDMIIKDSKGQIYPTRKEYFDELFEVVIALP